MTRYTKGYRIDDSEAFIKIKLLSAHSIVVVKQYISELRSIILGRDGAPFRLMIDALQYEGTSAEGYALLEEFNHWMNQQGLMAKAFVTENPVKLSIAMSHQPSAQHQNIQVFSDIESAAEWLSEIT